VKIAEISGRQYRIFMVASIHEDASYVECRAMDNGDCVCEIRIDSPEGLYLMPMASEADVDVVAETIAYAKEVARPSAAAASN
jgi:hypothetical protein